MEVAQGRLRGRQVQTRTGGWWRGGSSLVFFSRFNVSLIPIALLLVATTAVLPAAASPSNQLWVCKLGQSPCDNQYLACAGNGGATFACIDNPCYPGPCPDASAPTSNQLWVCTQGHAPCENTDIVCVGNGGATIACVPNPCQLCKPLESAGPTCETMSVDSWAAGATWYNCIHVSGYACTDPVWYGGHGILGWVCEGYTTFGLP
jgi:hypothetical protein